VNGVQKVASPTFAQFVYDKYGKTTEQQYGTGLVDGLYSLYQNQGFVDEDLSGFVNAEYDIFDKLTLSGGVRVSHLKQNFFYIGGGPVAGVANTSGSASSSPVTPKFTINYKPSRDHLLYISAAKGYRAGGANTPPALRSQPACVTALSGYQNTETYAPDSLWSYEAGYKGSLFGGKLRVDASAFHIKWSNLQNNVTVPQCGSNFIANLGEAKINGFDLGLTVQATRSLLAELSVGYTSAKYSQGAGIGTRIYTRAGEQIADTPPWNVTAALEYQFGISSSADGYFRVEDRYKSRDDGEFSNFNPANVSYNPTILINGSVNELNLRLGTKVDKFDLSIFANNVLGDHSVLDINTSPLAGYPYNGGHPIRPTTIGMTGTYRW
jgi:outer membrane receptor protein involved in Fe transport